MKHQRLSIAKDYDPYIGSESAMDIYGNMLPLISYEDEEEELVVHIETLSPEEKHRRKYSHPRYGTESMQTISRRMGEHKNFLYNIKKSAPVRFQKMLDLGHGDIEKGYYAYYNWVEAVTKDVIRLGEIARRKRQMATISKLALGHENRFKKMVDNAKNGGFVHMRTLISAEHLITIAKRMVG